MRARYRRDNDGSGGPHRMASLAINDIDLSDIEFWAKPEAEREAVFKLLRDEAPITFYDEVLIEGFPQGPGYWALTRYADVVHVSRHPELFVSGRGGTNIGDIPQELAEFLGSIINMDDPRHKKLRGLVNSGFGPKQLNQLLDQVQVRAAGVIDAVAEKGECDFVSEIAALLPLQLVCDMVGVPPSLEQSVFAQTNVILGVGDPEYVQSYEDLMAAFMTLHQMATELGQHRLDNPADDITSILMHAEVDGERLTVPEFASFFILLVVAGNETTRTAISHGMLALQDNPEQKARWMGDFNRYAQDAVEEIVRWATPVIHFRRTATQDTEIDGHPIKEGEKVVMFFNSANRDDRVFDDPFAFDITRSPNPHVGYGGGGPHFCLGANLARAELQEGLAFLAPRMPGLALDGAPAYGTIDGIYGLDALPVRWS
jgi:methyl-branched lipid omega-hydroxylase